MLKEGKLTIEMLTQGRTEYPKQSGRVERPGTTGTPPFTREANGLVVRLPDTKPNEYAYVLKIRPV